MTKINGSDAMLKVIYDWGIDHIFGFPGGSFDSSMNAIYDFRDKMKFIEVRHEEAGALAASAEYKLTGKLGVCFGSAGPGAAHLFNGLYDAKFDKTPMVAIVANVPTSRQDIDFFQAFDEDKWFLNASVWCRQAKTAEQIPILTDEAIRQAYERKGPAIIIIPKDYGWQKIDDNFRVNKDAHPAANYPAPTKASVEEAVKLLKEAKNPTMYIGLGARDAGEEVKEFAEKFKTPIMSSYLGKGVVEDKFPAYMGTIGRVGPKAAQEVQTATDLVVWVGNNSPFSILWFPKNAKVIQIDVDSSKFGKRHSTDVSMLADAKKALRAIIDAGEERNESPLYKAAIADRENWDAWQASFKDSDEMPVRPEPIWDVINKKADDNAIFAIDVGNVNVDSCRLLNLHDDQKWATSGLHATMGFGAPAALAAATVYPDREVWQLSGDGGFAMMNQELLTMARYNMHVLNIVFTNETLGYIQAEQEDESHQPLSGVIIPDNDWSKVAEGMNVKGVVVRTKKEFEEAVDEFKKMDGPMLIDIKYTREMPYSTELNTLDDPAFVKKYEAEDLKPFSYFTEKYGVEADAATGASQHEESEPEEDTAPDTVSGASQH
ncbi:MAG: pyruvate oxidase [Lactobacillus crispatus]|uniref:pyruvate oxidase n=1 Tax=Lactobacillus crispatus TaxID=47770 RepID=UPI0018A88648|nr:pyruvate oxidase [Lactobacillus crispatus]MCH4003582.1 pyruvate oxidase [Lactobacillus crispatus]MCI1336537.1 pyruvate oxidase [Lactobacillus crispatus]MCI1366067.1 pyruvate oxidase [Lactobacillus crispatus]MCI1525221.1 pyruvate oxidase [Lactobacillus crispatus]MCI1538513.1 pyruvate oxidase [Lactobacillus crispatus]